MTAAELIKFLQTVPPETPLAAFCGGDCPGYDHLRIPHEYALYPHPNPKNDSYCGELLAESDYQTYMRCEESSLPPYNGPDYTKTWPLPEGKKYLVF